MEEFFNIDTTYDPKMAGLADEKDSLTGAVIAFLRSKGYVTEKATGPIVRYEGQTLEMSTRMIRHDVPMTEAFEDVFTYLSDKEFDAVIVYVMRDNYMFSQPFGDNYEPVGEPTLTNHRIIRLGLYREEE